MDGRIILAVGGLIVIIIVGALYMQQYDFEGFRIKAIETEERCAQEERGIELAKASVASLDYREQKLAAALQLVMDRDELTKSVKELRQKRDSKLEDFLGMVKAIRNRDIGTSLSDLVLKNGVKLKNVRFTGINSTGLAVVHENGASRLGQAELPDVYAGRYRLDLDERLELALSESKPKPAVQENPDAVAAVTPPSPTPDLPVGTSRDSKEYTEKLATLTAQSTYYHQQLSELQNQKTYYLNKASSLNTRSTYSSGTTYYYSGGVVGSVSTGGRIHSDPALAVRAEEQAKELDKQIATVAAYVAQVDAQLEVLRRQ